MRPVCSGQPHAGGEGAASSVASIGRDQNISVRVASRPVRREGEHRNVCSPDHSFAGTPEQRFLGAFAAPSRHRDQIDIVLTRVVRDGGGDAVLECLGGGLNVLRFSPVDDSRHRFRPFGLQGVDDLASDSRDAIVGRIGDVENGKFCSVEGSDIEDVLDDDARRGVLVRRAQNSVVRGGAFRDVNGRMRSVPPPYSCS